ncbi:MAG: D-alanyl-D-alanine carboxypeptidase [Clostridia bacterium]|nr:D-alanyl-D-alanine carboxypeptidase [Clostridia bacterium]
MIKKLLIPLASLLILTNTPLKTSAEPKISAKSGIVIEAATGTVLYSKNHNEVLPMASTTKIMTALVAVELGNLDREMTVSEKAAAVEGSQMGLLAEQKISFRDLLYMMLLRSANDAAEVIAENLCGSIEKFVELMNEKALELGCTDTHFANVHGLPHNDHYTTAADFAKIAAAAYANDTVREIVSTKTKKLDYFSLVLENSNKLLTSYPYATGMKTGFTKVAGRCLVSAAEKDEITLIAVTLNAPDDWNDHEKMLDYGFSRVSRWEAVAAGAYSAEIPTLNGASKARLINTQSIYGLAIDGKALPAQLSENLPKMMFAPLEAGKTGGYLHLTVNGKVFSSSPLAVAETVPEKYGEISFAEKFFNLFRKIFFFYLTG